MIWLPEDDTSAVFLTSAPEVLQAPERPARPLDLHHLIEDEQGAHALLPLATGNRLQILATGAAPLAAVIPLDGDGFARLEAVYRLLAALHGRRIPPDKRLTRQQRIRARHMLRAFDAAQDGATQQDIAQALFHMPPISRSAWQTSSLRHTIKGLLRDARAMAVGGYRRLLRPRR